jgi:hypothetical protein
MIERAIAIARRVFETELAANGIVCELRKRLQDRPDRTAVDDTDDTISIAYGRKDAVNETPLDWEDNTIFDFDESAPVEVRIWTRSEDRVAELYAALQRVNSAPKVTASLDSDIEEGDVLVNTYGVYEVVSVNQPTSAVCLELELVQRG